MRSVGLSGIGAMRAIGLVMALIFLLANDRTVAAQEMSLEAGRKLALDLVNQSRAEQKLPPLKLENKLTVAAQRHAEDMYKRSYFAHKSPEGKSFTDRFQAAGGSKWLLVAENISMCGSGCKTPLQEALIRQHHRDWMNSPGHRANILRKGLDSFGYGILVDKTGKQYAVQTFSGPGTPGPTGSADVKPISREQQLQMLGAKINEARKAAGRKLLQPSPSLVATAANVAPAKGDANFKLRHYDDPMAAVPDADKEKWQYIGLLAAQCGGCGVEVTAGDMTVFIGQWFADPKFTKSFTTEEYTHFGFTVAADGNGRKTAVVVLAGASPQ